tara:strand:+ start:121 stop:960 length:840 start_codon:yes stop_codon:yes gene_type:complete
VARAMSSSYNYGRLDGKVVVVAGAGNPPAEGHGIGSATSLLLARHGATVISVSNVAENCQTVTDIINGEGLKGFAHTADCTSHDEAEDLHERVIKDFGRCDVLINAGIHSALPMGFDKMTEDAWGTGIALNLDAHFNLCHTFLPTFLEQESGNIIHFTTIASSVGLGIGKQRHAYAAGKAAAATLTRRLGVENATKGVRGNVIAIGYVTGPLVNRAVAGAGADIEKVTAVRDAYVPRQKQGTPMEVASIAAFLASDDSSLINGTEVYADGGTHGCTYGP